MILSLCRSHGEHRSDGVHLRTNLSQEELAEMLGVSRRSLNRALAELRDLGLIHCGRRAILIPDTHRLFDWLAIAS